MPEQPDQSHWVKDEFVLVCGSCDAKFSLSIRRHHCRRCGEVFCSSCTGKMIELPSLGYPKGQKQRVCESCFTVVSYEGDDIHGNDDNQDDSEEMKIQRETIEGLKRLYRAGIKPLEVQFKFGDFYSPIMSDADFDAKPMVLLIGQYSVGKTSFVRYLVGRDFPGQRIGPEPTTDRFTIISGTDDKSGGDSVLPGNALAVQADKPFRSLQKFGAAFLDKLECAQTNTKTHGAKADILRHISFVDTPGVLSGEKQRIGRSYDYTGVVEWFAGRCDRILLLFDAHKLDISDEFQAAIGALRGHDEKIRVVLNKADSVDAQQLMRVHGALMWSLGKIIKTPEVVRVYVGSFWDKPIQNQSFLHLFQKESTDLIDDLTTLPKSAVIRKVNEVVKRARAAKTHALIIDHLRTKLPYFGKEKALKNLLKNLETEYQEISRKHNVPLGDFPRPSTFQRALEVHANNDLSQFPPLNPKMLVELNEVLSSYLPRLHSKYSKMINKTKMEQAERENPFHPTQQNNNIHSESEGSINATTFQAYKEEFRKLNPEDDKLDGGKLRGIFMESGLTRDQLRSIWDLADQDCDGALTLNEFAIAKYLIELVKQGNTVPAKLPPKLLLNIINQ